MITKGTKIKLVKRAGLFNKVGEVCEVIKVTENLVIFFKCSMGIAAISYDEFERCFTLCEEEHEKVKKVRTWSEWKYEDFVYVNLDLDEFIVPMKFRTNGKVVDLRTNYKNNEKNIKVKASCNKYDQFDYDKGVEIADARMFIKLLEKELEEKIDDLD